MSTVMESCPGKTVMSGVMGFALGGAFGLFMASMQYDTPLSTNPTAASIQSLPLRQQIRQGLFPSFLVPRASRPPPYFTPQTKPELLLWIQSANVVPQQASKISEHAPSPPLKTSAKSAPSSQVQNAVLKVSERKTTLRMVLWLVV